MTKTLILVTLLLLLYLYWKYHQTKTISLNPDDIIERKEVFWGAQDFDLNSDSETENQPPDWFAPQKWLTDPEIDWALNQIESEWIQENSFTPPPPADPNTAWEPPASKKAQPCFKILPTTQFLGTKEALTTQDRETALATLLSELDGTANLVFIPVNNPNYHWSLLVYETPGKKFYHFDTLQGANDSYVQPLVQELLTHLLADWQDPTYHWTTEYTINQSNSYDCGVAVIALVQKIITIWSEPKAPTPPLKNIKWKLDLPSERTYWRQKVAAKF